MSSDVLDRLREADPAAGPMPDAPDDLFHALVSKPYRRPRPRRTVALGLAGAAAAVFAAALLVHDGGPSLAEQAYAKSSPAGNAILYVRTTTRGTTRIPGHDDTFRSTEQRWEQGERWRSITRTDDGSTVEEWRDADGVMHWSNSEGQRHTGSLEDDPSPPGRRSMGFLEGFRSDYELGRLDESGDADFAGRSARRYVATWDHGRNTAEWFIDTETGLPLGSRQRSVLYSANPQRVADAKPTGRLSYSTTVEALKQLPDRPDTRAKLAGP